MFDQFKDLRGLTLASGHEHFGTVEDIYFDDVNWKARYVVADVGGWFTGHRALISTYVCGKPDLITRTLPVAMTREEAETAPGPDVDPPVSEQLSEISFDEAWPTFLMTPPDGLSPMAAQLELEAIARSAAVDSSIAARRTGDPHLRSAAEILGYAIHSSDGNVGTVDDLLIDPAVWDVSYLVVDTGHWLPGKHVVISPTWTEHISWQEREVKVSMSKKEIERSPDVGKLPNVDGDALQQLYRHYGYVVT